MASRSLALGLKKVCVTSVRAKPLLITISTWWSRIWIGDWGAPMGVSVPEAEAASAPKSNPVAARNSERMVFIVCDW